MLPELIIGMNVRYLATESGSVYSIPIGALQSFEVETLVVPGVFEYPEVPCTQICQSVIIITPAPKAFVVASLPLNVDKEYKFTSTLLITAPALPAKFSQRPDVAVPSAEPCDGEYRVQ